MNKTLLLAVLFIASVMSCRMAFAGDTVSANKDIIVVLADGVGATPEDALKDAFKNAVYKAVGVYVLSETTTNNDDIKDKVLLNSDAVVKSHQVVESTSNKGVYKVVIRANVMKNEIASKVRAAEASSKITQDHVLSSINSLEATDTAIKAFHAIMADYPQNVVDVRTLGAPMVDESNSVDKDGNICMVQKIRISVNLKKYAQLTEKLKKLFVPFAKKVDHGIWKMSTEGTEQYGGYEDSTVYLLSRRSFGKKYKDFEPHDFIFDSYQLPLHLIRQTFGTIRDKTFSIDYNLYNEEGQSLFYGNYIIDIDGRCCRDPYRWTMLKLFVTNHYSFSSGFDRVVMMPVLRFRDHWLSRIDATLRFTIDKEDLKQVRKSGVKAVKR